ncbi:hypothetical protein ACYSUW_14895 [Pseudomonas frederiksbergensis]
MNMIPVHSQDLSSKAYSRIAKDLYKSVPELGSYTKALECLAQAFGYSDYKQVLSLASFVPSISKTPDEYTEILKENINKLSLFDASMVNLQIFKYLVSFGYHIQPVTEIDKRTLDILSSYYLRSILLDLGPDDKLSAPLPGFKKLLNSKLSSVPEADQKRLLSLPLPEFFSSNHILKGYSSLSSDFEQLHRAKCFEAIKEATHTGFVLQAPGIRLSEPHDENQVFLSMTVNSVVQEVCLKMLDVLVGYRIKAIDFFIGKLDPTPIKLSDFYLKERNTRAAVRKEYSEARKEIQKDFQAVSFDEFSVSCAADADYQGADLEAEYKSYLRYQKDELKESLEELRSEYEIELDLQSIEKKKKYGSNHLVFKLAEEYGEGENGCIVPYSWHCSIRTDNGDILALSSGHLYQSNDEYVPDVSDIFIFEDNYTLDYDAYATPFEEKLKIMQGIGKSSWYKPDISEYLDAGTIVFLKNLYRDQGGKSSPGEGIAVLDFAVACIYKFFSEPMLLVAFVDPPQYTHDNESQPASINQETSRKGCENYTEAHS